MVNHVANMKTEAQRGKVQVNDKMLHLQANKLYISQRLRLSPLQAFLLSLRVKKQGCKEKEKEKEKGSKETG